ncbi:MAG: HD domain-containing protein [Clostridium sp.]|nr:HD domain-containing protein [Acetatifactor muris]MCM1526062.1 HD domain-containing protein [Bacteroides sp.]MCM1562178.1 HD domain-containing protein [Clostridium sp.]
MRKMTLHILISVLVASGACILGILLLMHNINIVSVQYEENISESVRNRQTMADISQDIYRTESLVWQHIVNVEESEYDRYEEQIGELLDSISDLFAQLETNLADDAEGEMLHTVVKQYVGFKSNTQVVLELSRDGSKQSAQYYVGMKLNPYFDTVNDTMAEINGNMEERGLAAAGQMEESIRTARLAAFLCLVVVVFIIVVCLIVVSRHGRRIVNQQEEELKNHQQRVMELQYNTIVGMANLIEGRDGDTGEHVKRTGWFVDKLARKLAAESIYSDRIDETFLENLWKAAPLHDIGKIKVPDAILQKPGRLTKEEFEIMKGHAAEGGEIIYDTMGGIEERDYIEMAHDVAKYHHEKWDGSGYPEGRSGEDIPLCARIMAVADVFDALTSKRCYKAAMSVDEAYKIIEDSIGSHFDPVVAKAFIELRPEVVEYLRELREKTA